MTKKKKVCHIITCLDKGGAEAVLYRLCTHDSKLEHQIISLRELGYYGPLLKEKGFTVYSLDLAKGKMTLKALWRLWRILRKEKSDLVQTWMPHADLLGGLMARLALTPKVFWGVRQSIIHIEQSKQTTNKILRICKFFSRCLPTKIIFCAQQSKENFLAFGYYAANALVIENGYDLSKYSQNESVKEKNKQDWQTFQNILIGMVGRFDPIKDHYNLLKAFSLVKQKFQNTKLALIGLGLDSNNQELMNWLKELKLEDSVLLLGLRNDIPAIMNTLDIHVLSSISEGFPNVVAEAMACGTPCVVTDVGDAAHIVGETGWVVPPQNAEALAEAIEKAIIAMQDKVAWEARRQAARKRIEENFSIETMVEKYHQAWGVG